MKKSKGPVTEVWLSARKFIKENNLEQAAEALDKGVIMMAEASINGVKDKDLIEGVKREVWLERFWISIEKYIWPTYPDYEKNWKLSYDKE